MSLLQEHSLACLKIDDRGKRAQMEALESSIHFTSSEGLVSLLVWVLILCLSCLAGFDYVIEVPQKEHCFSSCFGLGAGFCVVQSPLTGLFMPRHIEGQELFLAIGFFVYLFSYCECFLGVP